jgi:hypothetical protein
MYQQQPKQPPFAVLTIFEDKLLMGSYSHENPIFVPSIGMTYVHRGELFTVVDVRYEYLEPTGMRIEVIVERKAT